MVAGGVSFLLYAIGNLPKMRVVNIRYDQANRFCTAGSQRLGTGVREVKDAVAEVDPRRMLEAGEDDRQKAATPQKATTPPKPAAPSDEPPVA